jgi:5-methylthioadenosine/S-adenosylhomocysteine deaminase
VSRDGRRPIARLDALGLLSPRLLGVHAVHLDRDEIDLLSRHGCHVAHCPSSNLKLASGFAPAARLLAAGVNVALGTDGAASNNRLDVFEEMRLCAMLAKAVDGRAEVIPAHQALAMATLHGARALGLDAKTGSIEPGKAADLTAVNLGTLELSPCYEPVSHLVYAAGRSDVTHVWIDGAPVLEDRRLTRMDCTALRATADRWAALIQPTH